LSISAQVERAGLRELNEGRSRLLRLSLTSAPDARRPATCRSPDFPFQSGALDTQPRRQSRGFLFMVHPSREAPMTERTSETFLGLDIGTSSVKRCSSISTSACGRSLDPTHVSRLIRCGASRTRPIGSRELRPRSRDPPPAPTDFARLSGIGPRAICMARALLDAQDKTA